MKNRLVSIIIPTYNRAHLIGETLDSIVAQTYPNWECLVVDDGSTDDSEKIFNEYRNKDQRFLFFSRPNTKPKGANSCRNIGLEKARGDYIVFFDSDDLMTPDHLEVKVGAIVETGCDYIITRTKFFNKDSSQIDNYYKFDQFEITPYNYITQKINWLTLDVCIKSELAKSIAFNEQLHAGQEYNYFSKLVHYSVRASFFDRVVSLRRHHEGSIRSGLKNKEAAHRSYFNAAWHTYLDLKPIAEKDVLQLLIRRSAYFILNWQHFFGVPKIQFYRNLYGCFGWTAGYHLLSFIGEKYFKRGYFFRQQFKRNIKE